MYKILGADQKEYGPVDLETIRQWIKEGRANAQSLLRLDGTADWKPLGAFPELAAPPPLTAPPFVPYQIDTRKSKLAAGLLGIFLGGMGVHRFYLGYVGIGVLQIVVTFATCGIGHFWGVIEGILIIADSGITTDAEGRTLKD